MKKTLNIDDELLRQAKEGCGAATDTEVVKKGLEALVRHAAYQRIKSYFGMEPDAVDVPRHREKPREKRKRRARGKAV